MDRIYKNIKLNQVADFSCEGCCLKRNIEDNGKLVANSTHICGLWWLPRILWHKNWYMFKSDMFVALCSGEFSGNIMYNNESTRLIDNYNVVVFFLK